MKVTMVEPMLLEAPVRDPGASARGVRLPTPKSGRMDVPQSPSLGIEVDEKAMARFRAA